MNEKILVPLDGSPFAERVLPLAQDLTRQRGAELHLYHALEHPEKTQQCQDYLSGLTQRIEESGLSCRSEMEAGKAGDNLLKKSGTVDLIVMSSHGRSDYDRLVMGSVAEKVVRGSECPVLVVKERLPRLRDIRRILVPVDGFELSLYALPEALRLAGDLGAELVLCQINEAVGVDLGLLSREKEEEEMREHLQKVADAIEFDGGVRLVCDFGSAARTLLSVVERENVDLVVMSSHGRGGFNRWLCGSVAENLTRHSTSPVLLVRADSHRARKLEEAEALDHATLKSLVTSPEKLAKGLLK